MRKSPALAGLDGLLDLDQKGIDIRPTLLRVLTDQFVQSPSHTPDEIRQYTELAMRLIDETDITTRAAVSARLATHPCAPRPIILQLARDVLEVAEPILKHSPCLTPADCDAIVAERGPVYAEFIAKRGQPETADEQERRTEETIQNEAAELCEIFFAAGSPERRLILMSLDYASIEPAAPLAPMQRTDIWRLETAALQHNAEAAVRELQRALGVSHRLAGVAGHMILERCPLGFRAHYEAASAVNQAVGSLPARGAARLAVMMSSPAGFGLCPLTV
jgi:hypothetical protein